MCSHRVMQRERATLLLLHTERMKAAPSHSLSGTLSSLCPLSATHTHTPVLRVYPRALRLSFHRPRWLQRVSQFLSCRSVLLRINTAMKIIWPRAMINKSFLACTYKSRGHRENNFVPRQPLLNL
jgi:hypothetical protein